MMLKVKSLLIVGIVLACLGAWAITSNGLVYLEDSAGVKIWSGDKITVISGGVLDIESGGVFKIGGTAITATATDLNTGNAGPVARSVISTDSAALYNVPVTSWLNPADAEPLVGATLETDGTMNIGGVGTGVVGLVSNVTDDETETNSMATIIFLPAEYVAGSAITVSFQVKITNAATTATIDMTAQKISSAGAPGSDVCATAVQTITTSFTTKSFTITPTGLVAGDRLQIVVTTAILDAAGGSTTQVQIAYVNVALDIKG